MNYFWSPLTLSLVFFTAFCLIAQQFLTPLQISDALDCFVISGVIAVLFRYGQSAFKAFGAMRPSPEQLVIVSICGVCIGMAMLRLIRQTGVDFAGAPERGGYLFTIVSVVMIWSIFLKVIAPPIRGGHLALTPWAAVGFAIFNGTLFSIAVYLIRWYF